MALYERLMGIQEPKIAVHDLMAYLSEVQRGSATQANAFSGLGLDAGEQTEAITLFGTFTGSIATRLARSIEVHDVLILAETFKPPYTTVALVKTRLGV